MNTNNNGSPKDINNSNNNGSPSSNSSNKESPILALNRLLKQENIEIGTGPSGSITSRCRRESDCKLNKSSGAGNFKPIVTSNSISTNSLITPPRTSLINTISNNSNNNNNNNNNTINIININDIKNTITDDTNTINTNTMGDTSPIRRLRKGSLPLPSLDSALANNNNNNNNNNNRIIDNKLTSNNNNNNINNNNNNKFNNNNVISNITSNTNKINNSTNLKSIVKNSNNNKVDIRKSGKNLMYYKNQHNQQELNIIKINKQDTDGRLQLFIVDTKRTLKNASTELDGSTIYIEIAKRLVEIATQFYNCKQSEIDYENFAEELLSILNSTNFKVLGKCRELVIKLLTIIAKYARVIQLISFEKSTTTATSPIIEELELLKIDESEEPDNLQKLQLSSHSPNENKEEQSIEEISSMEQPLSTVTTSQLSPSETMIEKNPLNFQKSHYRCLSYSPKLLEQQLQQQQKLINQQIKNHNQLNPVQHQKYVKFELQKSPTTSNQNLPTETTSTVKPPLISRKPIEQKELPTTATTITTLKTITSPTSHANESTDIIDEDNILSSSSDEESTSEDEITESDEDQVSEYSSDSNDEQDTEDEEDDDDSNYYNTNHHEIKKDSILRKTKSISPFKKSHQHHFSTNSTGGRNPSKQPLFLKDPRLNDLKTTSDEYILKRPLVRSKSFSPNKEGGVEEETVKKEPYRKLARSFSEIPSVKLVDEENSRSRDEQQQLQMAMCRICEESIHSSLLEVHSKICAMANEEDMRAMNVEDHLRAVAKILLTRSSDIAPEKRKMIIELREIALFAVENGIKENLKMIQIMNDIIKKFDPKDDNRELAIKIQNLISEKVNALKRADDVINSSPRIYRTNSPRILKSPREEELSREIIRGRSRSDSDPVHITMNKNNSGGSSSSSSSITSSNSSSNGGANNSIINEYKPKGVPTISDFEFIKPITKGGYGKVFLAKKIRTGDIYAIKRLKKSDMIKKNQLDHVRVERNILAYTSNPFVVKMYYSFQTKDYYYLVMEYLQGGDCFSLLQMLGALDENMAKMIIAETVLALEYLHSHGIIHRDLKPDNLLIDKNGHIKLTDFGLSKVGLLDKQTVVPPSYFSPTLSSINGGSNTTIANNNNVTMVSGKPINTTIGGSSTTGSGITEKKEKKLMSLAQSKSLFSATSSSSPSIPSLNLLNQDKQLSPMMLGLKHQLPPMSQLPLISSTGGGQSSTTSSISSASANSSNATTQQTPPLPPQNINIHRKLSCVGTPDYLAPEILLGIGHGASADWFSLGVILYEFLCGVSPFSASSVQQTFQNILQRNISWPDDMSPEAKDIIDKLLSLDPKSRLGFNGGAEEIKKHPFFKSINWKTILTQEPYFKPKIENLQDTSYFEPRKEIFKVSDDLGESVNTFNNNNNNNNTSPTQLPNSNVNLDSSNYTISQNTNANFDDFLYVNFQSLLELNKNYLAETKPTSNHRRRNST